MSGSITFALVLVGASALTTLAVILLVGAFPVGRKPVSLAVDKSASTAFLFEDGLLINATERAQALLQSLTQVGAEPAEAWPTIASYLGREFAGFEAALQSAAETGRCSLTTTPTNGNPSLTLTIERVGLRIRLSVECSDDDQAPVTLDRLTYRSLQNELTMLRLLTEDAPLLMWREDNSGAVTWANAAYLERLSASNEATALTWPLPALFDSAKNPSGRACLLDPTEKKPPAWFDLVTLQPDDGRVCFGLPADTAHKAEQTKHEFMQTLTKTFATLPIGLAVFDKARRLQMFSPALADLTRLEPEFLLSRPGIEGFLNRMREKHVLPEPRDFRAWTRRLLDIEARGRDGDFEEVWSLSTGQTFRVRATPHPDGALAFFIEDFTSETHLNRNIRAGMDTSQSVLDLLDDAIAVFAPNGQLVLTNDAFSRLWTLEGEESLNAVTLPEALANWRDAGDNPEMWSQVATLARAGRGEQTPVSGIMGLGDGERLAVDARRTATGALMIAFSDPESQTRFSKVAPRPQRRNRPQMRASA